MRNDNKGMTSLVTTRLDSLIEHKRYFFLKIDVEGNEQLVMNSIDQLLRVNFIQHIVMETRNHQVNLVASLYDYGYDF